MGIIALLVLFILSVIITRFTKPIIKLTKISSEMAKGNLEIPISTAGKDEVGVLSRSFVHMRDSIREKILELEQEINERMLSEIALTKSEERYRTLTNNLNVGVYRNDPGFKGRFIEANPAIIKLFGYGSKDEFLKTNDMDLYQDPDDRNNFITKMIQNGAVLNEELQLKRKDGVQFTASVSAVAVLNEEGEVKYHDGIIDDITERKLAEKNKSELEARLQQAHKMEALGTLAGGIAHDFNNILMGIQGRTSMMLSDSDTSIFNLSQLKEIEEYINKAKDLTMQLLGFARGGKYEIKPTNFNDLIRNENRMFGRTRKEINIQEELEQDLWTVEIDRGQIEQVLLNIYVNAWHAMPGGGNLLVKTKNVIIDENNRNLYQVNSGKYVRISITDTGTGMDKETRQRIFDPFFTTREMGRGTGLGLASAYGIIKNHKGFIDVYSKKGEGTTFNIYLPISDKLAEKEKTISKDIVKGTETVLLVDDEKMILDVCIEVINSLGYQILIARNGKEAIDIYKREQNHIDLIVLDMIMPGIGGRETYDRLKEINQNVKVLLSSGYSIDGQATEILDRGCNGFIQKPFNMAEISKKIREILDTNN